MWHLDYRRRVILKGVWHVGHRRRVWIYRYVTCNLNKGIGILQLGHMWVREKDFTGMWCPRYRKDCDFTVMWYGHYTRQVWFYKCVTFGLQKESVILKGVWQAGYESMILQVQYVMHELQKDISAWMMSKFFINILWLQPADGWWFVKGAVRFAPNIVLWAIV